MIQFYVVNVKPSVFDTKTVLFVMDVFHIQLLIKIKNGRCM